MPTLRRVNEVQVDKKRARCKNDVPKPPEVVTVRLLNEPAVIKRSETYVDDIVNKVNQLSIDPSTLPGRTNLVDKELEKENDVKQAPFALLRSPTKSPFAKAPKLIEQQQVSKTISGINLQPIDPSTNQNVSTVKAAVIDLTGPPSSGASATRPKSTNSGVKPCAGKQKKMKDPNAPKRAKSAYSYYQIEMQPKIKIEFPGVSFGDTSKIISQRWKVLDADGKKKYQVMAMNDRVRYYKELGAYQAK